MVLSEQLNPSPEAVCHLLEHSVRPSLGTLQPAIIVQIGGGVHVGSKHSLKTLFVRVTEWVTRIACWTLAGKTPALGELALPGLARRSTHDVGSCDLLASLDIPVGTHYQVTGAFVGYLIGVRDTRVVDAAGI
jgi:hypothetical protein